MSRKIAQAVSVGKMGLEKLGDEEGRIAGRWIEGVDRFINGKAGERTLNITAVADANVTVGLEDEAFEWTALTATRTATLPLLADVPVGKVYYFRDSAYTAALGLQINIVRSGSDAIEQGTSIGIAWPGGRVAIARGNDRWLVHEQGFLHLVTGGSNYRFAVVNPNTGASENASIRAVTATGGGSPIWRLVRTGVGTFEGAVLSDGAFWFRDLSSGSVTVFKSDDGSLIMSDGSGLTTTATDGYFYNHSWAGRPSGTPTSRGDCVPNGYDRTNYREDAYINGAWESVPIRCLSVNVTPAGNVGAGEDTLHTFSLPANTLSRNGESIEIEYAIFTAANANNKRVRVYFGATTMHDTGAAAASGVSLVLRSRIYRTGAATQQIATTVICAATWTNNAICNTAAETLSGAVTIRITGEGVADNDVVCRASSIRWVNLGV